MGTPGSSLSAAKIPKRKTQRYVLPRQCSVEERLSALATQSACSPSPDPDSPAAEQTLDEAPLPIPDPDVAEGAQGDAPAEVDLDADIEDADVESIPGHASGSDDDVLPRGDLDPGVDSDQDDELDEDTVDSDGTGSVLGRASDDATMQVAP